MGQPVAFLAERLPEVLDNAIKEHQEIFYKVLGTNLTPEDVLIPVTHPKRHLMNRDLPGISRFPVDMSIEEGALNPVLTGDGWMMLARAAYEKDEEQLHFLGRIFRLN